MRYVWAVFVIAISFASAGCGGSDPEPPPGTVPEVPAGRAMPGADGGGGGAPMPAPPK